MGHSERGIARKVSGNEVALGANPWRAVAHWLGRVANEGQQLIERVDAERRVNDPYDRRAAKIRDMREVSDRIVLRLPTEGWSDDVRGNAGHNERVAIRLRARHQCRCGHATGATAILDIEVLAETGGQGLRK